MLIAFWGVGLFLTCILLHIVIWRLYRPTKGGRALVVLFLGVSMGAIIGWTIGPGAGFLTPELLPNGIAQSLHSLLLAGALMAAYIASYPAIEADSPTLLMIRMIAAQKENGLPREELFSAMNDDVLVIPRLDDLIASDLATRQAGTYKITPKGRNLANLFRFTRRILKAEKGG